VNTLRAVTYEFLRGFKAQWPSGCAGEAQVARSPIRFAILVFKWEEVKHDGRLACQCLLPPRLNFRRT
jgi:hypothetical protein